MLNNKKYISSLNDNDIFNNTYERKIPQTIIKELILNHFENSQKKPKCLFIGWDGCRADAMKYILNSDDNSLFSAVNEIKSTGGLYITYVGGEKSSPQETSTAQGWASALCGKWMKKKCKIGIEWSLDEDYPTILKLLSLKGYTSSFNAIWPIHFDKTYAKEIEYAHNNNLNEFFYKFETDEELNKNLIERIENNDDFIFGIFENPDINGHSKGFSDKNYRYVSGICNLDKVSYKLLTKIKERNTFNDEDWLIIIASDHGGHSLGHGSQKIQDSTTFLAVSKPITEFNL